MFGVSQVSSGLCYVETTGIVERNVEHGHIKSTPWHKNAATYQLCHVFLKSSSRLTSITVETSL